MGSPGLRDSNVGGMLLVNPLAGNACPQPREARSGDLRTGTTSCSGTNAALRVQSAAEFGFRFAGFGFLSDFDVRISDFPSAAHHGFIAIEQSFGQDGAGSEVR